MNEKYVVSLELSKRLKELGVRQESEFWWERYNPTSDYLQQYTSAWSLTNHAEKGINNEYYSAFLSDELLEMLPTSTNIKKVVLGYELIFQEKSGDWNKIEDNSLPNALAKMLIYLLETGIIKAESPMLNEIKEAVELIKILETWDWGEPATDIREAINILKSLASDYIKVSENGVKELPKPGIAIPVTDITHSELEVKAFIQGFNQALHLSRLEFMGRVEKIEKIIREELLHLDTIYDLKNQENKVEDVMDSVAVLLTQALKKELEEGR